jgi:hypothetical protein
MVGLARVAEAAVPLREGAIGRPVDLLVVSGSAY